MNIPTYQTSKRKRAKDRLEERSCYEANGHIFEIQPVYLGEEAQFYADCNFSIVPNLEESEIDDASKVAVLEALLKKSTANTIERPNAFGLKTSKKTKLFQGAMGEKLVDWLEKKVKHKGKYIVFTDLERKYGLNKVEIYNMIEIFFDLSNFPQHLRLKKS